MARPARAPLREPTTPGSRRSRSSTCRPVARAAARWPDPRGRRRDARPAADGGPARGERPTAARSCARASSGSTRSPISRSSRCRGSTSSSGDGEMIAIVGASGSGKSTLLNILGGLDTPSAGRAVVAGHDLAQIGPPRADALPAPRRRDDLAADGPEPPALPDGPRERRAADDPRRPAAAEPSGRRLLLELVGLGERLDHRPERLSGGEQQRVAIAVVPRQRAGRPVRRRADGRARHDDLARDLRAAPAGQRGARDDDRDRHPRPARVRAGPADGRDPRRPDLDRDGPPHRS